MLKFRSFVILGLALALASPALAKSSKKEMQELQARVAELETSIQQLQETLQSLQADLGGVSSLDSRIRGIEGKIARLEAGQRRGGNQGANPEQEQAANRLLSEAQQLIQKADYDGARAKLAALTQSYGATAAARRSQSLRSELGVFGKEVPADLGIQKWFQGEGEVDLASGKPTVIVFWEVWCGYCRREVPKIEAIYEKYKDQGLQVVGMTTLSKGKTEESVRAFMEEQKLSYPIARESGTARGHFAVRGIPAAAAIKDGKIVWRGHPSLLSDALIASWL